MGRPGCDCVGSGCFVSLNTVDMFEFESLVSIVDVEVLAIVVAFRQRLKSMAHVLRKAQ